MENRIFYFSLLVTLIFAIEGVAAIEYNVINSVPNTTGGVRFNNEIGTNYSRQTLISATDFIWRIFQQNTTESRKNVSRVTLIIDNHEGVAYAFNNEIHLGANYIAEYSGDVRREITGLLYHEMTHIWQWNGKSNAPGGLIEGIADFVRLKSGYIPSHWVESGEGNRWDQGYDVTARFLDYLNGLRNGFVAELNARLRNGYSANYFVELLGNTVDQLWSEYKASLIFKFCEGSSWTSHFSTLSFPQPITTK